MHSSLSRWGLRFLGTFNLLFLDRQSIFRWIWLWFATAPWFLIAWLSGQGYPNLVVGLSIGFYIPLSMWSSQCAYQAWTSPSFSMEKITLNIKRIQWSSMGNLRLRGLMLSLMLAAVIGGQLIVLLSPLKDWMSFMNQRPTPTSAEMNAWIDHAGFAGWTLPLILLNLWVIFMNGIWLGSVQSVTRQERQHEQHCSDWGSYRQNVEHRLKLQGFKMFYFPLPEDSSPSEGTSWWLHWLSYQQRFSILLRGFLGWAWGASMMWLGLHRNLSGLLFIALGGSFLWLLFCVLDHDEHSRVSPESLEASSSHLS